METTTGTIRRGRAPWRLGALALAVTAGLAGLAAGGVARAAETAPLDRRVSVDLDHVRPAEAFRTFAQLAGLAAAVDAAVQEPITVRLENVRLRTLLDAVCESAGCRWEVAGSPAALRVARVAGREPKPAPARVGLRDPVDLKIADGDARELLRTLANLLAADLALDPAVQGKVTLDAQGIPLQQVLDGVCRQAGCAWALEDGAGGGEDGRRTLKVAPKG
jgi:hypothetical protein